ncbi:hypothetical protein BS17DRAFT_811558 [Gyrodon lividus]|nr:hypothetical protein BS17DRAFT_811558 [Gyrodon lividus]
MLLQKQTQVRVSAVLSHAMATNNTGGEKPGIGSKIKFPLRLGTERILDRHRAEGPFKWCMARSPVSGIGENIRGTAMGAADTVSSSKTGESKYEDIAATGQSEIAEGMARMRGHPTEPVRAGVGIGAQGQAGEKPPLPPPKDNIYDQSVGGGNLAGAAADNAPQPQPSVHSGTTEQMRTSAESARGRKRSDTTRGEPACMLQDQSVQGQPSEGRRPETESIEQVRKGQTQVDTGYEQQPESSGEGMQAAFGARETEGTLIGPGADAPQGPGSTI